MNSNLEQLSRDNGLVLVEMYASWCPHCQRMMPIVAEVAELTAGRANIYQFDIDKFRDLASQLEVDGIPTFIIYKEGEEQWRSSGEMDGNVLLNKLQEFE